MANLQFGVIISRLPKFHAVSVFPVPLPLHCCKGLYGVKTFKSFAGVEQVRLDLSPPQYSQAQSCIVLGGAFQCGEEVCLEHNALAGLTCLWCDFKQVVAKAEHRQFVAGSLMASLLSAPSKSWMRQTPPHILFPLLKCSVMFLCTIKQLL